MNETLKKEVARKTIHLTGLAYIPLLIHLGRDLTAFLIILATLIAVFFELFIRQKDFPLNHLLRDYEKKRIPGYVYTGMAFSLITPLFSTEACIISAVTAFAGDGVAGIVKKIKPEMSIPAFILPCLALIFLLNLNLIPALISIVVSSFFDGKRWEDNFTIPLSSAISYQMLALFLR